MRKQPEMLLTPAWKVASGSSRVAPSHLPSRSTGATETGPGTFKNEAKRMRNAPNMAMLERILDDFR